jgi:hypothetical protein
LIIFSAACKVAGPFGDYPIRFLSIINSVESLDIYQVRVPTSVFAAHYLKTNIKDDRESPFCRPKPLPSIIINTDVGWIRDYNSFSCYMRQVSKSLQHLLQSNPG